jgi:hypothetical protein
VVEKPEDNASASRKAFKLLQLVPLHVLCINKQLHVEAKREFLLYIQTIRLVMNCNFAVLLKFLESVPIYVKENIKRMYLTSKLLYSYNNKWATFAWKKQTEGEWSPICQKIMEDFTLEELAIYAPYEADDYYRQEAALEVCYLLETAKVQRVQFVFRNVIIAYNQDCDIPQVQTVLRGAYAYPKEQSRRERPTEFLARLAEWRKLPQIFNVQREDEDASRDELWWAAGDVLSKNYPADLLKHNGVRTIITIVRRED